jgi:hypothetical protein
MGFLAGIYQFDVYAEARDRSDGRVEIDFLRGKAMGPSVSRELAEFASAYRGGLANLCAKHGTSPEAFSELHAVFSADEMGVSVVVTVADQYGHRAEEEYFGNPARRAKIRDDRGRVRKMPGHMGD